MSSQTDKQYQSLLTWFREAGRAVVAFSGGVDSALVLKGAIDALGKGRVTAVLGESESLAVSEREIALRVAGEIGADLQIIKTTELSNTDYQSNKGDRCYYCKQELYSALYRELRLGFAGGNQAQIDSQAALHALVVDGLNLDDLGDDRPGRRAAEEFGVRHPLVECGFTKSDVRAAALLNRISVWDKAETACLSSRVQIGVKVTPARLRMIETSENALRAAGFRQFRVRLHELEGGAHPKLLARIEVDAAELARLTEEPARSKISRAIISAGFNFVTVDLFGYRRGGANTSGSLKVVS